jgi:hypothetical protein
MKGAIDMIHVHALKHGNYNDQLPVTGYIYLHGQLQDEAGFDLCHIDQLPEEDGIYDCEVTLTNGLIKPAKLYFWKSKRRNINRGLIVSADHQGDNHFAALKFRIRSNNL